MDSLGSRVLQRNHLLFRLLHRPDERVLTQDIIIILILIVFLLVVVFLVWRVHEEVIIVGGEHAGSGRPENIINEKINVICYASLDFGPLPLPLGVLVVGEILPLWSVDWDATEESGCRRRRRHHANCEREILAFLTLDLAPES